MKSVISIFIKGLCFVFRFLFFTVIIIFIDIPIILFIGIGAFLILSILTYLFLCV